MKYRSSLFLSFSLSSLDSDLFVVLLKGSQILSGLGELTLLHTLTDVPVDEGSLGVHKIELVVESAEDLGNGGGVGDHAASSHDLGEITSGHDGGRLVVDADLEASGAPVDELDGSLGLDGGNGSIDVLGDDVSSVHHRASHVLSVSRVALGHHVGGLKATIGNLSNGELLMVGLFSGDDGGVGRQHEVNSGVGDEVGLELSHIDVEGTVEAERGSEGGDDLRDKSVEVGVGGSLDVKVSSADIVDGLVVEHDSDVSVLKEGVGGEDGVVGLDDGSGDLRGGVDGEAELGLLSVVDGESLEEERSETGSSSTTDGVEHEEALKTSAVISKLSDSVEAEINDFLSDGVVSSGEVVGGIFLSGDELFGVEELSVGSGSDLINDGGLEIEEDTSGDVLSCSGLGEEGVEGIITATNGLVRGHLAIGLDSVLETEQLPAGVTDLDTSLTNVNGDNFSHDSFLKFI